MPQVPVPADIEVSVYYNYISEQFLPSDTQYCPVFSYCPLVNALNGEVIKISEKSNDYINPMEVNLDVIYHPEKYRINGDVEDIDTIIADKAEFITSFCEVIMKKPQNAELNGDVICKYDTHPKVCPIRK